MRKPLPFFKIGSPTTCVYCGDDADALDHVIAVSYNSSQAIAKKRLTSFGPVAHCCHKCNSVLSNKFFETFIQRCEHINNYYDKKAKPIVWNNGELASLDISIRSHVEKENNKRKWYRWRADWYQSRDFVRGIECIKWQNCLDKSHPQFNEQLYRYFQSSIRMIDYYGI